MDKKYIELFKGISQTTAVSAETVMEYDRQKDDQKGLETATIMRNDYQALTDRISTDGYNLNKSDAAKLLVGVMILVNQLQDKINNLKKAIAGYQTDIIPKLQDIVDNAKDDNEAKSMADEKFIIQEQE